ncbi:hypothetical protein PGB90_002097 [Kerria lacca]
MSSCESRTSTISSSGLSETTTYITCSSEIEPVQMIGFHCINEPSAKHQVSVFNKESYENIHNAAKYDLSQNSLVRKESENINGKEIVLNNKVFSSTNMADLKPEIDVKEKHITPTTTTHQPLVNSEAWSTNDIKTEILKSPELLKQVMSNFEDHLSYKIPKTSTKTTYEEEEYTYEPKLKTSSSKTVMKSRSLLNLDLCREPPSESYSPLQVQTLALSKATSETNLQNNGDNATEKEREKKRITKTISVMLENRQRQLLQNECITNKTKNANPALASNTEKTNISPHIMNEKTVNENVVLIEPSQQQIERKIQTIDRSCRVTGEILKNKSLSVSTYGEYPNRNVYTLPRSVKSHRSQLQRHFYYPQHVGRSSTRVLDEELPDPDIVKNARELFEKVLKTSSLENINCSKSSPKKGTYIQRPTPEIRQPLDGQLTHTKLRKSLSVDTSHISNAITSKWTDNGSLSSGVGSDISAETDLELSPKGTNSDCGSKEDVIFTSDEDLSSTKDIEEAGKPISQDILNNIRAYGTSVTYYGGKIIASTKGYACSPMTMTIMNEIRQLSPDYHMNRKFLFDDKQISKFKLIKSNSCGSRLELSDTDEYAKEYDKKFNGILEDYNNNDMKRETDTIKEEEEEEQLKKTETWPKTKDTVVMFENKNNKSNSKIWCKNNKIKQEDKTKSSYYDMEFEQYEVLDEKSSNINLTR